MKQSQPQLHNRPHTVISDEELNVLIDTLIEKRSPTAHSTAPEAIAATHLAGLTGSAEMSSVFSDRLKKEILSRTHTTQETPHASPRWWKKIALPLIPISALGVSIYLAIQWSLPQNGETTIASQTTEPVTTVAPLIGAEVLSEEEVLAQLTPPEGGYNIDMAQFQRALNAQPGNTEIDIHIDGSSGLQSDHYVTSLEEAESEPKNDTLYSELKKTGNDIIESHENIITMLAEGGMDTAILVQHVQRLKKNMAKWPTDQMPFDPLTYERAINDLVTHNTEWNRLMNIVTQAIITDYQKKHPDWNETNE